MKTAVAFALFLLLLAMPLSASAQNVTLSSRVWSKYLLDIGAVIHDDPVIQTDMFVTLPRGFFLDVWHSSGIDANFSSDAGDEVDFTIGWSGEKRGIGLNVGISYFNLADLLRMPGGDIVRPFAEVSRNFNTAYNKTITPYLRFELLLPASGDEPERHVRITGAARHSWRVTPKLSVNQDLGLVYNSTSAPLDEGVVAKYGVDFSWRLSKSITLDIPSIKATTPLTSVSDLDGRKTEVVYGAGMTFRF